MKRSTIICSGYGPHISTALQSAQTLAEWCKVPAMGLSAGALRHGFIEVAGPGVGAIIFSGDGPTQAASRRLAQELASYGARQRTGREWDQSFHTTSRACGCLHGARLWIGRVPLSVAGHPACATLQRRPGQGARAPPPRFRYLDKVVQDFVSAWKLCLRKLLSTTDR